MMKRPDMRAHFASRIDYHVHGMMSGPIRPVPRDVLSVAGTVTDREIVVTMTDGTVYRWEGGRWAARKVHGCYAPLMPKPIKD